MGSGSSRSYPTLGCVLRHSSWDLSSTIYNLELQLKTGNRKSSICYEIDLKLSVSAPSGSWLLSSSWRGFVLPFLFLPERGGSEFCAKLNLTIKEKQEEQKLRLPTKRSLVAGLRGRSPTSRGRAQCPVSMGTLCKDFLRFLASCCSGAVVRVGRRGSVCRCPIRCGVGGAGRPPVSAIVQGRVS